MSYNNCILECQRIEEFAKENNNFQKHFETITSTIVKEKYSSGGLYLHRGYYCPSKIVDIIGNATRGRIIKNVTHKNSTYKYGFNNNNELVYVKQSRTHEFIQNINGIEISIILRKNNKVESVSECTFYKNGKLKTYAHFIFNTSKNEIFEYYLEDYKYSKDSMTVYKTSFYNFMNPPGYRYERYDFSVEDGYLTHYTIREYDSNNKLKKMPLDDCIFDVYRKRKI